MMFNMIALTILCFMIHCIFLSITVLFSRVNNQFVSGCGQDWILIFQNAVHVHVWALVSPIFRSLSISCALHHSLSNVMAWRAMFLFAMSSPPPFSFCQLHCRVLLMDLRDKVSPPSDSDNCWVNNGLSVVKEVPFWMIQPEECYFSSLSSLSLPILRDITRLLHHPHFHHKSNYIHFILTDFFSERRCFCSSFSTVNCDVFASQYFCFLYGDSVASSFCDLRQPAQYDVDDCLSPSLHVYRKGWLVDSFSTMCSKLALLRLSRPSTMKIGVSRSSSLL